MCAVQAYLFGRLTNQWCMGEPLSSSRMALAANTAMIVRIYDEPKESADAFTPDD